MVCAMRYATKLSIQRGRLAPCSTVPTAVLMVWQSCLSLPDVCISQVFYRNFGRTRCCRATSTTRSWTSMEHPWMRSSTTGG
eukprot:2252580-Pyramimonas_sp.AAC.1